jgi:hypothetical protein
MSQRGVTADLVSLVLEYGEWDADQCRLDRRRLRCLITEIDRLKSRALKVLDKGGVAVVEADGHLITTYARSAKRRGK